MSSPTTEEGIFSPVRPDVQKVLDEFGDIIHDVLLFGSRVFGWWTKTQGGGDYVIPSVMMLHRTLEYIGAIEAQVRSSWAEPAQTSARVLFEHCLYMEHLVREERERRGYAYLVFDRLRERRTLEEVDPTSEAGKRFRTDLGKDEQLKRTSIPVPPDIRERIARIDSMLKKPGYVDAMEERARLKKESHKSVQWYSLFSDKPAYTLEELARQCGRAGQYQGLYRGLSRYSHGGGVHLGKLRMNDGRAEILQIGLPDGAQHVTGLTVTFALSVYNAFLKAHLPGRMSEYSSWYAQSISERYLSVTRGPRRIVIQE